MSWAKATQLQVKKKIFKTEKKKKFFHILYCRHVLLHDWAIHDFHTRFPTIFHFAFNLPLEVAGKSLFDVISDLTSWSFNFNVFFLFFFYSDFFFLLFFPPICHGERAFNAKNNRTKVRVTPVLASIILPQIFERIDGNKKKISIKYYL